MENNLYSYRNLIFKSKYFTLQITEIRLKKGVKNSLNNGLSSDFF